MTQFEVQKDATRMLNHWFLHAIPAKHGTVQVGSKYTVRHAEYGEMGVVECTNVYTKMLNDLKPVELMMLGEANLIAHYVEAFKMYKVDTVQVCTFRFVKRNGTAFHALLRAEAKKKGFPLVDAPTLFDDKAA